MVLTSLAFDNCQNTAGLASDVFNDLVTQLFGFAKAFTSVIILKNSLRLQELDLMWKLTDQSKLRLFQLHSQLADIINEKRERTHHDQCGEIHKNHHHQRRTDLLNRDAWDQSYKTFIWVNKASDWNVLRIKSLTWVCDKQANEKNELIPLALS